MNSEKIICVTPNAALDRTMVVPDFAVGQISRISGGVVVPGGKGLNMMRAVKILGGDPLSMGLLGGHTGRMVADMVQEAGYQAHWTWFKGETRTCTIIANSEGVSTVINESGQIAATDWNALADDICHVAETEDINTICFCGSLPSGAPEEALSAVIKRLGRLGKNVWIDTSGQALVNAIASRPYAIKVNSDELAAAVGVRSDSLDDIIVAAKGLIAAGIHIVVVSMGAEGAILLSAELVVKAIPPRIQPVDPIASGDCLHAGIVMELASGNDFASAIRSGVAAGTVNVLYPGGAQFRYEHYQQIHQQTRMETLAI